MVYTIELTKDEIELVQTCLSNVILKGTQPNVVHLATICWGLNTKLQALLDIEEGQNARLQENDISRPH